MGLFAASDMTIKALGSGYSPFQIMFFAGLFSLPLLVGMAELDHSTPDRAATRLRPLRPGVMALRCVIFVLNSLCATYAFATLPLAQCSAIFFTMPILITLLSAVLLGERIDLSGGVAVLTGLVVVLVFVPMPPGDLGLAAGVSVAAFAGYIAIITAYRHAPAIVVAPMQYSQILWAALLGALVFNEVMSLQAVLGVVIIIASGLVILMRRPPAT